MLQRATAQVIAVQKERGHDAMTPEQADTFAALQAEGAKNDD
jgi:hypothetical protein